MTNHWSVQESYSLIQKEVEPQGLSWWFIHRWLFRTFAKTSPKWQASSSNLAFKTLFRLCASDGLRRTDMRVSMKPSLCITFSSSAPLNPVGSLVPAGAPLRTRFRRSWWKTVLSLLSPRTNIVKWGDDGNKLRLQEQAALHSHTNRHGTDFWLKSLMFGLQIWAKACVHPSLHIKERPTAVVLVSSFQRYLLQLDVHSNGV